MNINDSDLIEKCLRGDKTAFSQLVTKYKRPLYALAHRMMRSHEDADDLSQEAFVKAYENLHQFQLGTNFRSWLFRIVTNLCIDQLRRSARFPNAPLENADARYLINHNPQPDKEVETAELRQHIYAAIDALPEAQRTVVILREMEGLSHREIAKIMKASEKTVRWRLHQARKKLREMLKEYLQV